jgi:hypothetical protein
MKLLKAVQSPCYMMLMACFDYRSALPLMFLPYNIARRMPFFKKSVAGMKARLFVNFLALTKYP